MTRNEVNFFLKGALRHFYLSALVCGDLKASYCAQLAGYHEWKTTPSFLEVDNVFQTVGLSKETTVGYL